MWDSCSKGTEFEILILEFIVPGTGVVVKKK